VIITRRNDRRLRISATDWVKNGDRWTVLNVSSTGALRVRHAQNGRIVTLPAHYVRSVTELGYATTSTAPKASPSIPCTASLPARSLGSSSTPC
jgi:hypothetical protein